MLLELITKSGPLKIFFVKSALAGLIIFLPFQSSHHLLQNDLISKLESPDLKRYVNFLDWLSYYQNINAKLHNR
jgi:hypothetical protein